MKASIHSGSRGFSRTTKEFEGRIQINQALKSTGYFARPFASWERGSNENFNILLRQYVPKKRLMSTVDEEKITMI
jgi:IS30 family transposase